MRAASVRRRTAPSTSEPRSLSRFSRDRSISAEVDAGTTGPRLVRNVDEPVVVNPRIHPRRHPANLGDVSWEKVGGPGFGNGTDVAVSPDNTSVFVSGNLLSEDPDFFGGPAFIAEFTSEGKARRANTWGGSLDDGASAESVIVDATGLVVTSGFAGPGPYEFGRESNSAKNPDAHLVIPEGSHLLILSTALGLDNGQLLVTDPAVGGGDYSFTLWLQP